METFKYSVQQFFHFFSNLHSHPCQLFVGQMLVNKAPCCLAGVGQVGNLLKTLGGKSLSWLRGVGQVGDLLETVGGKSLWWFMPDMNTAAHHFLVPSIPRALSFRHPPRQTVPRGPSAGPPGSANQLRELKQAVPDSAGRAHALRFRYKKQHQGGGRPQGGAGQEKGVHLVLSFSQRLQSVGPLPLPLPLAPGLHRGTSGHSRIIFTRSRLGFFL